MRVLIAIDGSDCSRAALNFVEQSLWKPDDQFLLVTVVETIPVEYSLGHIPEAGQTYLDSTREECESVNRLAYQRISHSMDQSVSKKISYGAVADEICALASEWDADLILLGSHSRKGFERLLVGSVAEAVLAKAPCSVQVVKGKLKGM